MAAAAETAMVKPQLPEWLLEIWREHVPVIEGRLPTPIHLKPMPESR
jgi:hypothetical protein